MCSLAVVRIGLHFFLSLCSELMDRMREEGKKLVEAQPSGVCSLISLIVLLADRCSVHYRSIFT